MTAIDRRQFNRSLLAVPAAALLGTGLGALAPAAASAAPADWDAHFLAGMANGELLHRMRTGDGSWGTGWSKVATPPATLYRVSCVGMNGNLHTVATLNGGTPDYGVRRSADGSWTAFTPIPSESGPTTGAVHVAVTALNGVLHVFGASEGGGALYHTVRNTDGVWQPRWVTLKTFGRISHIATTKVGSTIDTAVIADGRLFHAIRSSGGTWSGWGNIESAAGDIGDPYHVAVAGIGSQLHVVALNGSSGVFHAIRRADATWQPFRKVAVFNNYRPFEVSAANVGGELQVGIIDLATNGTQAVRHSIRRTDGTWRSVSTVSRTGFTGEPGVLAMAAIQ
ncbi:hypothetical protein [Glycomyces rhizosphaerae]|uniref:Uncharacterized protein n=1 Tax=Glycomyces rhizosphaerae TaxID=2054422 RepID=A0ABV7PVC9_9ACTN